MSWSWKSLRANTRWSLLVWIMLYTVMQSSHQNPQHWKQLKHSVLLLSQFSHFAPVVLHSWMANISSKRFNRKLVGNSFGFPLLGILNSARHSGQTINPSLPLVRWSSLKQWRQKLCKHGKIFGSVNGFIHTGQVTSSCRLRSNVFRSMVQVKVKKRRRMSAAPQIFITQEPLLILLTNHKKALFDSSYSW